MPFKDKEKEKAWRREWWKNAHSTRKKQGESRRRRRGEINKFLREYKLSVGCKKCGYNTHHVALDFHHRDKTEKEINMSFADSISQAKEEMKKCDVLCSNCHKIHHWEHK